MLKICDNLCKSVVNTQLPSSPSAFLCPSASLRVKPFPSTAQQPLCVPLPLCVKPFPSTAQQPSAFLCPSASLCVKPFPSTAQQPSAYLCPSASLCVKPFPSAAQQPFSAFLFDSLRAPPWLYLLPRSGPFKKYPESPYLGPHGSRTQK